VAKTAEQMKVSEALERSLQVLEEGGWITGNLLGHDGRHCALGAICEALDIRSPHGNLTYPKNLDPDQPEYRVVKGALSFLIKTRVESAQRALPTETLDRKMSSLEWAVYVCNDEYTVSPRAAKMWFRRALAAAKAEEA